MPSVNRKKDMTIGSEWKTILRFSLPIMGATLLQVAYNFVDSVIVGNFVSAEALGAIGLVSSMVWLVTAISSSLGNGTNIAAAQFVGAGRPDEVREVAASSYITSIILSAILTGLCFLAARPMIAGFLKTPEVMQKDAMTYFLICGSGIIFQLLYNVTYGILRAHGDSKGALIFLLISAFLNVGLDLILVIVFHAGVAGAAAATVISQAGAAGASMLYLRRHVPEALPKRGELSLWRRKYGLLMRLGVPIALQSAVNAICFIILQRLINSFGTPSIEGYAAMLKVEQFVHIPSNSFNAAVSSFTGQNIGAGKDARARRGYRSTLVMGVSICLVVSVIVFFADRTILGIFGIAGEALLRAEAHLDLLMMFIWVSTITNITNGFLQGAGDVRIPAISTLVNLSIRLSLSFLLALVPAIGWRCYFVSMPPAWVAACLLVLWRYHSGKWKLYRFAGAIPNQRAES